MNLEVTNPCFPCKSCLCRRSTLSLSLLYSAYGLRDAHSYVLVYDLLNPESFEYITNLFHQGLIHSFKWFNTSDVAKIVIPSLRGLSSWLTQPTKNLFCQLFTWELCNSHLWPTLISGVSYNPSIFSWGDVLQCARYQIEIPYQVIWQFLESPLTLLWHICHSSRLPYHLLHTV